MLHIELYYVNEFPSSGVHQVFWDWLACLVLLTCLWLPVTLHLHVLEKTTTFHVMLHSTANLSSLIYLYFPSLRILYYFFFQIKIIP